MFRVVQVKGASLLFVIALSMLFSQIVAADLQVFPLRVVLTEKNRNAQISVRHKGTKPMRYRITTIFYRMSKDGAMTAIASPSADEHFGDKYFRYSPRQVDLEPNVEQVVRLALRFPADLPKGEYRAHLHFEGIDEQEKPSDTPTEDKTAKMILKARIAVAIPIILRKGQPEVKVAFKNLKTTMTQDNKLAWETTMIKEGSASVYGDFELKHQPPGGAETVVGIVKGVSSYIPERTVRFPFQVEKLGPGKLTLTFMSSADEGGAVLATTETVLK